MENIDKIKQLYNKGTTYHEMCNILSLPLDKLLDIVRVLVEDGELVARSDRWGKKYRPRLTEEQKEEILHMYFVENKTRLETIKHFDIHSNTFDRLTRGAIRQGLFRPKKKGFAKGKYKGWQLKGGVVDEVSTK